MKDYFTEIHGSGVRFIEKSAVIDAIAQNIEHNRVLYLDDDAEQFRSEKITTITGLLTPLRTRPKSFLPNKQQPHKRQFNHCERGGELSLAVLPKSSAFF